ncbi:hypothetical protein AB7C87_09785 [Natrarchaeobius sp. A-rgal3]|uniref:hypothetical protein n=1 Tax=Natrarchaeobius versutus TaxID=1679078 RepID=UPI00351068C3
MIVLATAILTAGLLLAIVLFGYEDPFYRRLAPIAFVAHLCIGLIVVPALPYAWDIAYFHTTALELLEGTTPDASEKVIAFATFQAFLYAVFEPSVRVLAVFNSLFAVLIPIPAAYIARRLYLSPGSANGLTVLILFLPLPALSTSVPIRDAFVLLVTFVSIALLVRTVLDRSIWSASLSVPLVCMLYLLRIEVALLLVLGAMVGASVRAISVRIDRDVSMSTIGAILAAAGLLGLVLFGRYFPLETLNDQRQRRVGGGAAYLEELRYDSWLDVVFSIPTTSIYFQFSPFPLQIESLFHLAAGIYLVAVIVLLVSAFRSLRRKQTNAAALTMLITVYLGGIVGYGLFSGNFGATVRHRVLFDFLLVVFATPVLYRWECLLLEWFRKRPRDHDDENEQNNEAHELQTRLEIGTKHPD